MGYSCARLVALEKQKWSDLFLGWIQDGMSVKGLAREVLNFTVVGFVFVSYHVEMTSF